jgi:hypothetical protein
MRGLYYEPPCADMTIFNAFAVPFSAFTPRGYRGTEDTSSTSELVTEYGVAGAISCNEEGSSYWQRGSVPSPSASLVESVRF